MPSLPVLSGSQVVNILQQLGFVLIRQKGSHIILRRDSQGCVVPNHRELKVGTLSGVLKQAGVSVEEFIKIAKN